MGKILQFLALSCCVIPLTTFGFGNLPNAVRLRIIKSPNSHMNLIMQGTSKTSDNTISGTSGIYEFAGKGIPPEFRKLLGQKEDKKNGNKPNVAKKSTVAKKKVVKPAFQDGESLDDLEKELLSKYGSMPLKGTDWDEDDDDMAAKSIPKKAAKFDGFNPQPKGSIAKSDTVTQLSDTTSKPSKIALKPQQTPSTTIPSKNQPITSESLQVTPKARGLFSNRNKLETDLKKASPIINNNKLYADDILLNEIDDDDDDYNINENKKVSDDGFGIYKKTEKRRKSDTNGDAATPTFRLRPPPPMSSEQIIKAEKKKTEIEAKETLSKEKREKMKLADANNFTPFTFDNDESNKLIAEQLFTVTSFADLGINNEIVIRNLERMNIYNPTNIQDIAIRTLLTGKDIVMQAQTGSGKTLAFLLPLLNVVDPKIRKVQAMIIAPSRELVTQIAHVGETVFKGTGIQVMPLIGGANVRFQIEKLRDDRPQVLVATPGRLAEIVFRLEKLRLGMVRAVIVDEVDNLLREPYVGELETLLEATPLFKRTSLLRGFGSSSDSGSGGKSNEEEDGVVDELYDAAKDGSGSAKRTDKVSTIFEDSTETTTDSDSDSDSDSSADTPKMLRRLVCLSSATGNNPLVAQFASRLCGPEGVGWMKVAVASASKLPGSITHGLVSVPRIKAIETLKKILNSKPAVSSALIFVNDPHRVEVLCEKLLEMNIISAPLHGDSSKDDRKEVISRLRSGRIGIVVTTEIAARGLDFPELTHVINFELPTDSEHYVHRAGRCGRAGRSGLVLNFATPETKFVIRRFGKQLGVQVLDCELREGQVHLKGR